MTNATSRELAEMELSIFRSMKPDEQEKYLRELYCMIVQESSDKIKIIQPLHEEVKKACSEWNQKTPQAAQKYEVMTLILGVFSFMRVECEFYGKGVKRALRYASAKLTNPFEQEKSEADLEISQFHLQYIQAAGDSVLMSRRIVMTVAMMKKGIEHQKHLLSDRGAIKNTFSRYVDTAYTCANNAQTQFEYLHATYHKTPQFQSIRTSCADTIAFLNDIMGQCIPIRKKMDRSKTILDSERKAIIDKKWPEAMAKLKRQFSEMERKMDDTSDRGIEQV
uniref:Uncharacterized protein n=1 Tax=Paramoeba aestuarina TaxID=180227 RepID=A0A7S4PHM8_9EUKA|mmetsp:Transcript_6318/g.9584  ORF Transcript_6318/g.9584 Transcript_6318/m.9584 type:complete len:279 (+) Transcript_6318:24-860(+)